MEMSGIEPETFNNPFRDHTYQKDRSYPLNVLPQPKAGFTDNLSTEFTHIALFNNVELEILIVIDE